MKIEGKPADIRRILTGLYSFDRSFINMNGDVGFPLGGAIEIFGPTHCGKSTITLGLAGMIATALNTNIALVDLEGFDPVFLEKILTSIGFDNVLVYIQEKTDEKSLDELAKIFSKKDFGVGILDSVASVSPIAEQAGDLGDRNIGARAFVMSQFLKKILKIWRDNPEKIVFSINHSYPKIGGRGNITPGGEVKNYINTLRVLVRRRFLKGKYEEFSDGSYIIEGLVVKNRWGLKDKTFNLFVLGGVGIHPGLTAMYDAFVLGLAKRDKVIKIGNVSYGTVKSLVNSAREGKDEVFDPFYEILANHESHTKPEDTATEDENEDEEEGTEIEEENEQ